MRNYDSWNRYLDNKGNPLHGCVQFMVKDGNTVAPIYNSDGTPLSNPILTDIYGRTQYQVFVDVDVVAYFYSYIGNGIWNTQLDIDTSDQSKWYLQYTIENQNSLNKSIDSNGTTCIPTIADLRAVDVESIATIDDKKIITLLGYYNVCDKEPINYIWKEDAVEADNGGSVIQANNEITGRWIMVQPTEHCDSRHFGVFPANSNNTGDQTVGIINLFNYCNSKSIRPFFNGNEDYRWFRFNNLNVNTNTIDVTEDTRFYDLGNNTIQGEWNGNPNFTQGNTTVSAKNIKTSWNAKSYINYKNVVIDQSTDQKNWQDAHIDVQITPLYGYNFNHCSFEENRNIGSDNDNGINNTFTNCKLNERMFILEGDYAVSLVNLCTDCQFDIDDFPNSIWLYKQIRCTSDYNPFFDYRNLNNVGQPYSNFVGNKLIGDSIWVTNLKNPLANKVNIVKLANQTSIIFEDCTGWYSIPGDLTVIVKDSKVKLELNQNTVLQVTNSTVDMVSLPTDKDKFITASFRDSTLSGVEGYYNSFTSYNSILMSDIYARNSVIKDSQINGKLTLLYHDGAERTITYVGGYNDATTYTKTISKFITSYLDNNIFNNQLVIDAQMFNTLDNAHSEEPYTVDEVLVDSLIMTNNTSSYPEAWYIWPALGAWRYDNLHNYIFKNNIGTFECKTSLIGTVSLTQTSMPGILYEFRSIASNLGALSMATPYEEQVLHQNVYIDDGTHYFTEMKLFSIGTRNVKFDVQINMETPKCNNVMDGSGSSCIAHLTDQCSVNAFITSADNFKLPDVRNVNQIPSTQFDPIFNPANEFKWSPMFQIRNFVIGQANFNGGDEVTLTFKQLQ